METRNKVQKYWQNPPDKENSPEAYAKHTERSDYLLSLMGKYVGKQDSILEIGCNVGRNLNALFNSGYKNLTGVEISKRAIEESRRQYPHLEVTLRNSSVEDWVKEKDEYDCIFSMAVMVHLPYESDWVLKEISKKTRKVLITIEDEENITWKHFPRNYGEIFTKFGWKQIFAEDLYKEGSFGESARGYITRVFIRKPTNEERKI